MLVNLTTRRAKSDTTCVLAEEDFPSFIHHSTVINYGDSLLADVKELEKIIAIGEVKLHPDMGGDVLKRIIDGASSSPAYPTGLKKYL